jgi:predicted DNA-binding antitoxin AbrB/MazE fold protein
MTIDVDAVYEDGVLKPEHPLALKEKAKVHVTIEARTEDTPKDDADPTGWKTIDRLIGCIDDTAVGEAIGRDHDKHIYK